MNAIRSRFALTGNQLKILAMLTMTIDHIGVILLPQYRFLRIIGRLSMPIYAYMIAAATTPTTEGPIFCGYSGWRFCVRWSTPRLTAPCTSAS